MSGLELTGGETWALMAAYLALCALTMWAVAQWARQERRAETAERRLRLALAREDALRIDRDGLRADVAYHAQQRQRCPERVMPAVQAQEAPRLRAAARVK